ncbi:MAG: hypothetical protein U9R79_03135 [Armatimonadota bacterium]|nr:hypothetical protein [Armatimonadota bacterium]
MRRATVVAAMLLLPAYCHAAEAPVSWWERDPNVPEEDRGTWITDMSFRGDDGLVALSNGHLWLTRNRGGNWGGIDLEEKLNRRGIRPMACAVDGDTMIVAAKTSHMPFMCCSLDGGHTWETGLIRATDPTFALRAEWWISAMDIDPGTLNAMAVGQATHEGEDHPRLVVVGTYDGGRHWHGLPRISLAGTQRLTGVCCRLDGASFVCGEYGLLVSYVDGNRSWSEPPIGELYRSDNDFQCMTSVAHENAIWAATNTGWVLRLDARHGVWHTSRAFEPTGSREREWVDVDMAMASATHGVLIAPQGIYRTTDGGKTWLGPDTIRRDPRERSSADRPRGDLVAAFTALRRGPWEAFRLGSPGARDWPHRTTVRRPSLLMFHGLLIRQPAPPQPGPRLPFGLPRH